MNTNESGLDRTTRVVAGVILLTLYLFSMVTDAFGILLLVVSAILIITGIVGFCPLYALLKINTHKS